MCMVKARILGHVGALNIRSGNLFFYGIRCVDVFKAFEMLKDLDPTHTYKLWTYRGKKGLENVEDGWLYVQGQWLPDKNIARDYVKNKCSYST